MAILIATLAALALAIKATLVTGTTAAMAAVACFTMAVAYMMAPLVPPCFFYLGRHSHHSRLGHGRIATIATSETVA